MDLLMITAVSTFEQELKELLKGSEVQSFSYLSVTGFHQPAESIKGNWFASNDGEHQSLLFYAFVEEGKTGEVLEAINKLNLKQESESSVHAVVMEIKKSI